MIILVESQRSMAEVCGVSPWDASKVDATDTSGTRPATFGHLSFAAGQGQTTMDTESYVHGSHALYTSKDSDFEKGAK